MRLNPIVWRRLVTTVAVHDIDTNPSTFVPQVLSEPIQKADDYVWDVFYHRPVTLSEWNEAAKVGTLWV